MNASAFKDAAHRRALPLGVITVNDPTASIGNGIRAAVFTEFCLALPESDADRAFAVFFISKRAATLQAIRDAGLFTLSFLRADRVQDAVRIYGKQYDPSIFGNRGALPEIANADTVFVCSFISADPMPANSYHQVQAEIVDHITRTADPDPLVNHLRHYWSLGSDLGPVADPSIQNLRL